MHTPSPIPRPKLEHWLRARKLDYVAAAKLIGCSRETIRRYCLPFSDPQRRFPNKGLLPRIQAATGGEITGHDFIPPVEPASSGHTPANIVEVAA